MSGRVNEWRVNECAGLSARGQQEEKNELKNKVKSTCHHSCPKLLMAAWAYHTCLICFERKIGQLRFSQSWQNRAPYQIPQRGFFTVRTVVVVANFFHSEHELPKGRQRNPNFNTWHDAPHQMVQCTSHTTILESHVTLETENSWSFGNWWACIRRRMRRVSLGNVELPLFTELQSRKLLGTSSLRVLHRAGLLLDLVPVVVIKPCVALFVPLRCRHKTPVFEK